MEREIEQFKRDVTDIHLSQEEKDKMKKKILSTISYKRKVSPYFSLSFVPVYALLLLLIITVPIVNAAQSSLPGEPLYMVKTSVIEKVQETMAFSQEEKTEFYAHTTSKRLSEAAALIKEGKANEKILGEVEKTIEASTAKTFESIEILEKNEGVAEVLDIKTDIKNIFQAHSKIFSDIYTETNNPSASDLAEILIDQVIETDKKITESITAVALLSEEEQNEVIKKYLDRMNTTVEDALQVAREDSISIEDVESLTDVQVALELIDDLVTSGEQEKAVQVLIGVEEKMELALKEKEVQKQIDKLVSKAKNLATTTDEMLTEVEEIQEDISPDMLYR